MSRAIHVPPCLTNGEEQSPVVIDAFVAISLTWFSMGPLLMFDKSFLQMLSVEEMDELALNFKFVITPILISEITADLRLPSDRKVLAEGVVRRLATKMRRNNGVTNAHFRLLGIAEMTNSIGRVSLLGQAIVDSSASNVHFTENGRGMMYDSIPEQRIWDDWSQGRFSDEAFAYADRWRGQIPQIDVPGIKASWGEFTTRFLPGAKVLADVISRIDSQIKSKPYSNQLESLFMIWHFLEMSEETCAFSYMLWNARLTPRALDVFPYATSVARRAMTFCAALRLNLVTARPANVLDLQYLFYALFSMVFVSNDRLHQQLWKATVGNNDFVWGEEMKADLRAHLDARRETANGPQPPEKPYITRFNSTNSVIEKMRSKYLAFDSRVQRNRADVKTIEDLDAQVQRDLRDAYFIVDRGH
jgi:hypothetical protein